MQAHRDALRLLDDELELDVEEGLGEAPVPSRDDGDDLIAAVQAAADAHSEALSRIYHRWDQFPRSK